MSAPNIKIAVAAHKPYWMPQDEMYVPVQAGSAGKETITGYQRDDACEGGGISELNAHLSELTVMYWAWKSLEADVVGLVHYRRQFAGSGERGILTLEEAAGYLTSAPVIIPKERNYYIESVGSHYDHTFESWQLDLLIQSVSEFSPESMPALYRRLSGKRAHMFNMAVMRRDLFEAYCTWMFPIVGRVERSIDYTALSSFASRMPGRLSEFLLDTWLETERISSVECPVKAMEPVSWARKGGSFLAAKFLGRKYEGSF